MTLLTHLRSRVAPTLLKKTYHNTTFLNKALRCFSSTKYDDFKRNIGISAHIDSGKTTLTERILYYTGKIHSIHDVRGKDGVGAKMDSMELEREKGITIQSAATFCQWKGGHMNIIDTPGHVDFTIEVERALRVLDGAVFVLCGVSGVQSQSITVDRQMKRYEIPRIVFINKLDRNGSNPFKVVNDLRNQLKINAVAVQVPIGLEDKHSGVIDLLTMETKIFSGDKGENITTEPIESADLPSETVDLANEKRLELIEMLADVDDEVAELFLMEEEVSGDVLKEAIRRQTVARTFVPVFMGSAFKNKGVQPLLDGVFDYLPSPTESTNYALDLDKDEEKVEISSDPNDDLLALAFKLEETQFGQLTYMRVYRGTLEKGQVIKNVGTQKKDKVPRIVRLHSDEMEDISSAQAGEVFATFGLDCASMDTFSSVESKQNLALSSMFVPEPVMSLSVRPKNRGQMLDKFGKALSKFTREDPTLRVKIDNQTKETVISGMGELHLDVYIERLKREFNVEVITGQPSVNYKETIQTKAEFDFLHKKQSGGSGQFAKVIGYIEPMEDGISTNEFDNRVIGTNIPPEYIPSCGKGMNDAMQKGALVGCEVEGVRVVLEDGQSHAVDSSDMAFRICMANAIRSAMTTAQPSVLEPIMKVDIDVPTEFQGTVIAELSKRMGMIETSEASEDGSGVTISAMVPLSKMFGYSTQLRSMTQGKGEFTMEYETHSPVSRDIQEDLIAEYREEREGREKEAA